MTVRWCFKFTVSNINTSEYTFGGNLKSVDVFKVKVNIVVFYINYNIKVFIILLKVRYIIKLLSSFSSGDIKSNFKL